MIYEFDLAINGQYIFDSTDLKELNVVLSKRFEELGLTHAVANLYVGMKGSVSVNKTKSFFPSTYEVSIEISAEEDKQANSIRDGLLDSIDGLLLE